MSLTRPENEMQSLATSSPRMAYLDHLHRGELAYQVDPNDRPIFFPRVLAPGSGAATLEWRISQGRGTVYATTVVFRREEEPLNIALVDLDEGFRMLSRVEEVAPESVRIGMRVQAVIRPAHDGSEPYPIFVPLPEPATTEVLR